MSIKKQKIIVILGQTATGKSDLAVKIAKQFNGEIISADSRQVYKELDIGTGKITKKEMHGIPHYMLDVVSIRQLVRSGVECFTAAEYKQKAEKIIRYIIRKGKIPIIVGGTGFYIDTLLGNIQLPNVPPNKTLRAKLQRKTVAQLFKELEKGDRERAKTIDKHNKMRLIRALEIVHALGKIPKARTGEKKYDVLKIGLTLPDKQLKQKITIRLFARIRDGMIAEVKKLHAQGLSWRKMEKLGLEYRYLAQYLQKKIAKEEMIEKLSRAIWQYARRQRTWFKRDKDILWFHPKEYKKIEKVVKKFSNKK